MARQDPKSVERARGLRKEDTEAERRLWEALRNRRLGNFKFVRQLSVGPYIANFACRDCRLIVEVDGTTHGTDAEVNYDERRGAYLGEQASSASILEFGVLTLPFMARITFLPVSSFNG